MTATATRPRIDPRIGRRRAQVTRDRGRRRLRALAVSAAMAVLAGGALVVLHSPLFSARHLQVVGAHHVTRAEVLSAAGVGGHPPLIDVDSAAVESRLESLPWVRSAAVARVWPDTLRIALVERRGAAVMAGAGAHQGRWALVDTTGRVLTWTDRSPATLPLLVAPVRVPDAGKALGAGARPGLLTIEAAAGQLPVPLGSVSVAPGGSVTITLADGVQAVLGHADLLPLKVAALRSVLVGAPPTGPEVVDVRVPGEPTVGPASS